MIIKALELSLPLKAKGKLPGRQGQLPGNLRVGNLRVVICAWPTSVPKATNETAGLPALKILINNSSGSPDGSIVIHHWHRTAFGPNLNGWQIEFANGLTWQAANVSILPAQPVPAGPDADGDLIADVWETRFDLNPSAASDAALDPDSDGLTNLEEFQAQTSPRLPDADADYLPDAWELAQGFLPNAADSPFAAPPEIVNGQLVSGVSAALQVFQ